MAAPLITISDNALGRIHALLEKRGKPSAGIKVGVRSRGCSGLSYTIEYADEISKFDDVVEKDGVKVIIDPKAVMFLLGTEMDFVEDEGLNIEDAIYKNDELNNVKVALTSLNDSYRQVISLYYIEQESISDVAKSLGKSEAATRVLLHRGIKKLKKHLES